MSGIVKERPIFIWIKRKGTGMGRSPAWPAGVRPHRDMLSPSRQCVRAGIHGPAGPRDGIGWGPACLLAIGFGAFAVSPPGWAAKDEAKPAPEATAVATASAVKPADTPSLEPFLPPKSARQSAMIAGKKIDYTLTVGSIALKDDKGAVTGEVVYTSYIVSGRNGADRPITFSMNGGPGAASAYLNLGVLGPKHIEFGRDGIYASGSAALADNPNSWLDFTDLVFLDPIGTGYSRSHLDAEATKKTFLRSDEDIHYLADVIESWLRLNGRTLSPKYLIGESYGGYRVPRLAAYLQSDVGIGVSGITLVSPAIDMASLSTDDALSPLPWIIDLPSMTAAVKERRGEPVTADSMAPIEEYARTEFAEDFLAGQGNKAATDRMSARVAQYLDLDPKLVRRLAGRVPAEVFVRESRRDEGKIGSFYESNQLAYDPFPERERTDYFDPDLGATAAFAEAMMDIVNIQVGWKVDARYFINNYQVAMTFDHTDMHKDSPVTDLRKAVANDPSMSVLIAHGYNDLACPYFMSKLVVAQMPLFGVPERVRVAVFPGGHMFYARNDSAAAFKRAAMEAYRAK
jgi:carboxypeptidase C (cathepsin A)